MPETSTVKRIYKWKPFRGRPAGRPKSRWEGDVRNDLKKMKLMKWAEQVQDRLKWKDIVESAKTLSELERHRRRRRIVVIHNKVKNYREEKGETRNL
jgi:hypothetical protein